MCFSAAGTPGEDHVSHLSHRLSARSCWRGRPPPRLRSLRGPRRPAGRGLLHRLQVQGVQRRGEMLRLLKLPLCELRDGSPGQCWPWKCMLCLHYLCIAMYFPNVVMACNYFNMKKNCQELQQLPRPFQQNLLGNYKIMLSVHALLRGPPRDDPGGDLQQLRGASCPGWWKLT